MNSETYIKKSSGILEVFNNEKLIDSLQKAGASMFVADDVAKEIEKKLTQGMPTRMIYSQAFKLLRKKESRPAIRYSLRRSIADLGPTGFPFENFVGEIFKAKRKRSCCNKRAHNRVGSGQKNKTSIEKRNFCRALGIAKTICARQKRTFAK